MTPCGPRHFNLFTEEEEKTVPAVGTKRFRIKDLQDLSILFDQDLKWSTYYFRASTVDDVMRRVEIVVGVSFSSA